MVNPPADSLVLTPTFHQPANALLRPDQVVVCTRYFFTHWLPRLGPERWLLVQFLRELIHQADAPGFGQVSLSVTDLAPRLGLTPKQLYQLLDSEAIPADPPWRCLQLPPAGGYKSYARAQVEALRYFIPRLRYRYESTPGTGTPRRSGFILEIALDDPLIPEDQACVNANFGIHAPPRECQIRESRPVNANFGTQPSVNLTVTGTRVPGCAAPLPPVATQAPVTPPSPAAAGTPNADRPSRPASPSATSAAAPVSPSGSREAPRSADASAVRTVDLSLPLPQLRERALQDLRRTRKKATQITIVAQFIGRLLGLGADETGLLRTKPTHTDHARVGELCHDFGAEPVLNQAFAIAGRLPETTADPLAYLRVALENQRSPARATVPAPGYGATARLDGYTPADYRAELPDQGGPA